MMGKNGGQFFSSKTMPARAAASSLLLISFSRLFNSASLARSSLSLVFMSLFVSIGISTGVAKSL
uniref:Uncharacterized protein n=1 Tax=Arundo donax TaxID=35708 RepID=A0A0A9FXS6_ARUDO